MKTAIQNLRDRAEELCDRQPPESRALSTALLIVAEALQRQAEVDQAVERKPAPPPIQLGIAEVAALTARTQATRLRLEIEHLRADLGAARELIAQLDAKAN